MAAFEQFILPALIGAGGQLGAGLLGGSSVKDAKRIMHHQNLAWVDRFRAQIAQQRRFMRDYGPGWQFQDMFAKKMKMGEKYGINKLAMLRGSAGMMTPPTAHGSQPSPGPVQHTKNDAMAHALVGMSQSLAQLVSDLAKSKNKSRGEYDYIKIEPTAEQGIEKPVAGSQATVDATGRIKVIPAEILGEAYDASPFQKIKGFMEDVNDLIATRYAWKRNLKMTNHMKRLWRVKEWLHQHLKVKEGYDIRISGKTGTWYQVRSKQRKLWLYIPPKRLLEKYTP